MPVTPNTELGPHVTEKVVLIADATIRKYDLVNYGVDSAHCALPTATGQCSAGIALDDAVVGNPVSVAQGGRILARDKAGTLNINDPVTGSDSSLFGELTVATTAGYVAGRVVGNDGVAAHDFVLIEINFPNTIF